MSVEEKPKAEMTYVRLGNSGLKVSRLILGLMGYGQKEWGEWILGEEEGIKHIKAAYDAGIQTFDTADVYSNGESERILGKAIKQLDLPRDEIVVMTKVFNIVRREPVPPIRLPDADRRDNASPARCGESWAMQNYAINNGLTPFIAMQNQYNLVYREEEREMMPTLKMFGVGMIPWSPLSQGVLSRPYTETTVRAQTSHSAVLWKQTKEDNKEVILRVEKIAKARNISMAQVALAWCLSKDAVTAPVVGTSNMKNLEDLIGGLDVRLSEEEVKELEEPYVYQAIQAFY